MNLKELRENRKLTQDEAAKLTGVTTKFISEIENGRRNPSDNTKEKLAKTYKVSVLDIFLACQRTKCSQK